MKRLLAAMKAALLLGATLLMAWSILPGTSKAAEAIYCKGPGTTCAVIVNDKTYWHKELE